MHFPIVLKFGNPRQSSDLTATFILCPSRTFVCICVCVYMYVCACEYVCICSYAYVYIHIPSGISYSDKDISYFINFLPS